MNQTNFGSRSIPQPPADYRPMASQLYRYALQQVGATGAWTTLRVFDIRRDACVVRDQLGAGYRIVEVCR